MLWKEKARMIWFTKVIEILPSSYGEKKT